ncbi:receptor-like protein EIX2 [Daucus carota subsp. sativus]|uniref:Uncharacterized protein n=1 Tax=Daucus carota subsp. sativus TaxID=79200 RepID=A0A175YIZ8_DAUCS|nr:PREDICTED: probable LRR receptor-like serine/threonine-protein kinase At4g36180 [Daucus carota subsp. sativus]XP_017224540.1 PREDICTED: probable LRR receptor-like serine/threonine-protein kinase At4g36180 [Daucus carota subsp. sativus]
MNLLVLACALAFLSTSYLGCQGTDLSEDSRNKTCIAGEKQVLLDLKKILIDQDKWLESWVGDYCCSWQGIGCDKDGHVTELDVGDCSSKGSIPKTIGNLTFLTTLTLSQNNFQGLIPKSIGDLKSLVTLELSFNNLSGPLPESFCRLSKLEKLDVGDNQLSGTIPKCIGQLSTLKWLDLFQNSWEGVLSEQQLVNLTSLTFLSISSKSKLVYHVSSEWIPPFQLQGFTIENMRVGPEFPPWLLTQEELLLLKMSNSSLVGTIPADWFGNLLSHAVHVDLSYNDISMARPSFISAPNNLSTLRLSNNRLSDEFPAYICNFSSLTALLLSDNNFTGELPRCLGNLTQLEELDVMDNHLSGHVPDVFGSLERLSYLNFYNNSFEGKLPLSFQNLTQLLIFDVGNNNFRDALPTWTSQQIPYLTYIGLRANHFYGTIPIQLCNFSSIQIINLARNHITGNIPQCFNNLTAMTTNETGIRYYFGDTLVGGKVLIDDVKGYELKYTSTLDFFYSINLSDNNISGEIPEELMDLRNLLNLNLAGNNLVGKIPARIGKIEQLEFLDLSRNKLSGPIPQSLSELKFLVRLNLSFNDLSGRIPTGNQLQTLDNLSSIYAGNNQLCGRPILKLCSGDAKPHEGHDYEKDNSDNDSDSDEHVWFYAGIGPGLLVGFLGFCSSLHYMKSWRHSYFNFVEMVLDKIAVFIALSWKKFYK